MKHHQIWKAFGELVTEAAMCMEQALQLASYNNTLGIVWPT